MEGKKTYKFQEEEVFQLVTGDSSTNVYVCLVSDKDGRKYREERRRRMARKAKLRKLASFLAERAGKVLVSASAALVVLKVLSYSLSLARGYEGVGSEYVFAGLVGVAVWFLLNS